MQLTNQQIATMTNEELLELQQKVGRAFLDKKAVSQDDKLNSDKAACVKMIDSCLTYGGVDAFFKNRLHGETYAEPHIKQLGKETVQELFDVRKDWFDQHIVMTGTACDSEGGVYFTYKTV